MNEWIQFIRLLKSDQPLYIYIYVYTTERVNHLSIVKAFNNKYTGCKYF